MKKFISIVLTVALLSIVVFSGCNSNKGKQTAETDKSKTTTDKKDSKDSSKTSKKTETKAMEEVSSKWFHKYDPPIVLTGHRTKNNDSEYHQYEQWAGKNLGIKYERKWVAPDNATNIQKLNLAIASNDLPDIITIQAGDISSKLIQTGMLLSLNDLIEKYGSPLTKYMINQFQEQLDGNFFSLFTNKGKYYAFPEADDIFAANWKNLWIRKDILDELGMNIPQTLDDFEKILKAYKAKYKDGLPYVYNMTPIMEANGAFPDKWVKDKDGKLVFGSVQPEVKEGLAVLKRWYKEGLIDQEFFIKDDTKNREKFVAGNGLTIYGNWWYVFWPFPDMWGNKPNAVMRPVPPLKGKDGKAVVMHDLNNGYFNSGRAISKTCKHPEALIYLLNEHLDSQYRDNKELRTLMKEKYNYEFKYPYEKSKDPLNPKADKKEQKWDYSVEGPDIFYNTYPDNPVHTFFGFKYNHEPMELYQKYVRMAKAYKNNTIKQLDMDAYRDYMDNFTSKPDMMPAHMANLDLYKKVLDEKLIIFNEFQTAPTKTMVDKNAYLKKLQSEVFTKIIIAEDPLEEFDKFVEEWYKTGGEQITKEVNEWYENK